MRKTRSTRKTRLSGQNAGEPAKAAGERAKGLETPTALTVLMPVSAV